MSQKRMNSFDLQYKLCMHPKAVTADEMYDASMRIRGLEAAVDERDRLLITYREEIRKLTMENQWLTQQLQDL